MNIKKLVLPLLVMAMMLVSTVAYAATLTITPSKTSGTVKSQEEISFVFTSDSVANAISKVSFVITNKDTKAEIKKVSKETTKDNITKFTYTVNMPQIPCKNISVKATVVDKTGAKVSKTFDYTMKTTNSFSITATPGEGTEVAKNSDIVLLNKASLEGAGIKTFQYSVKDANGTEIKGNKIELDDKGTGVGVASYKYTIHAPGKYYPTFKVTVKLTDTLGNTKSQTFNYSMKKETTVISFKVYDNKGKELPTGSTVGKLQAAKIVATSSNESMGSKTFTYTMTNVGKGTVVSTKTVTSTQEVGANPLNFDFSFPNEAGTYRVDATSTDINGTSHKGSFTYTIKDDIKTDDSNKLTVTAETKSGSQVTKGSKVKFVSTSTNQSVGTKQITLKVYLNNVLIDTKTATSSYAATVGSNPMSYSLTLDQSGTYKVEVSSVDIKGNKASGTFTYTVPGESNPNPQPKKNTLTISSDTASGSEVAQNTKVKFSSTSTDKTIGTKTMTLKVYFNNSLLETLNATSSAASTVGSNPMNYTYTLKQVGTYKIEVNSEDIIGTKASGTYTYVVKGNGETPVNPSDSTLTVTLNPSSGTLNANDDIKISVKASKAEDPIVSLTYTFKDGDGDTVVTETVKPTKENVVDYTYTVNVPTGIETRRFTLTATAKTKNGVTKSAEGNYTNGDYDEEEEEDGEIYEGVINPDGDGLAIDLWTVDKERMYELGSDIEFVAYYYNFEKSSAKNVVIEVEVPDGFKVKSYTTNYGSKSYKNDTIKYNIGTVPSKTLREVRFKLNAEDDDLSEEAVNITAVIYEDTDDEEDSSTQRIFIYENGEKGTRKAFITGYTDGTFRPENNITRQEVAAMMARAFNYAANSVGKTFKDVKTTSWSYRYILGCYNKNVIKGYTDGTFRPLNNITRAELYTMTYRSMGISEEEKSLFVPKAYKKGTTWETNYVAGLTRLRMLKDMKKDIEISDSATRAEVVYLISRVQFRNTSAFKVSYYLDVDSSYWNAKDIEAASYNYSYKRGSNGKETITTSGTFLDTNSNYIQ